MFQKARRNCDLTRWSCVARGLITRMRPTSLRPCVNEEKPFFFLLPGFYCLFPSCIFSIPLLTRALVLNKITVFVLFFFQTRRTPSHKFCNTFLVFLSYFVVVSIYSPVFFCEWLLRMKAMSLDWTITPVQGILITSIISIFQSFCYFCSFFFVFFLTFSLVDCNCLLCSREASSSLWSLIFS